MRMQLAAGTSRSAQETFIFGNKEATLVTEGTYARIHTPAIDAHEQMGSLQQELTRLFVEAKAAGIDDPIVVGSIPFDTTKPSSLFIPKQHSFVSLNVDHAVNLNGPKNSIFSHSVADSAPFQGAVNSLLHLMQEGPIKKVVLSRMLDVPLPKEANAHSILAQLLATSASGYHFLVPLSVDETLIGVSPELLLRKRGAFITSNPLAGTVSHARMMDEKSARNHLMNSAKDRFEHQIVVDEIRETLHSYCSSLSVPSEPSLLRTAALWHLSTVIEGVLVDPEVNVLQLASAIHPTPAVCGYPRDLAREAIYKVEDFDRGLFTGMTGWMNSRGDGEWVITIRCGILRRDSVRVFAGAGIVPGSKPELEWEETSAKMTLMLSALGAVQVGAL